MTLSTPLSTLDATAPLAVAPVRRPVACASLAMALLCATAALAADPPGVADGLLTLPETPGVQTIVSVDLAALLDAEARAVLAEYTGDVDSLVLGVTDGGPIAVTVGAPIPFDAPIGTLQGAPVIRHADRLLARVGPGVVFLAAQPTVLETMLVAASQGAWLPSPRPPEAPIGVLTTNAAVTARSDGSAVLVRVRGLELGQLQEAPARLSQLFATVLPADEPLVRLLSDIRFEVTQKADGVAEVRVELGVAQPLRALVSAMAKAAVKHHLTLATYFSVQYLTTLAATMGPGAAADLSRAGGELNDGWGRPLRIAVEPNPAGGHTITACSDGRDAAPGTTDDICATGPIPPVDPNEEVQ